MTTTTTKTTPAAAAESSLLRMAKYSPPSDLDLPVPPTGYEILPANVKVYSSSGNEYVSPADYSFSAGPPPAVQFTASMPSNSQIEVSYFMSPTVATASENSGTFTFDSSGIMNTNISAALNFGVPGAEPVQLNLKLDDHASADTADAHHLARWEQRMEAAIVPAIGHGVERAFGSFFDHRAHGVDHDRLRGG